MALHRVLVHRLAGEAVHLGDVLGRLRHADDRRRIEDVVREGHGEVFVVVQRHVALSLGLLQELFVELGDAVPLAATAPGQRAAHALDAQGDAALGRADHDRLRDAVQRLHAGAALAVGVERADLGGQPRQMGDDLRADADQLLHAQHVAQPDVLDHLRLHLRVALQQRPQHRRAGVIQSRRDQRASPAPREGRANAIHQDYAFEFHANLPTNLASRVRTVQSERLRCQATGYTKLR